MIWHACGVWDAKSFRVVPCVYAQWLPSDEIGGPGFPMSSGLYDRLSIVFVVFTFLYLHQMQLSTSSAADTFLSTSDHRHALPAIRCSIVDKTTSPYFVSGGSFSFFEIQRNHPLVVFGLSAFPAFEEQLPLPSTPLAFPDPHSQRSAGVGLSHAHLPFVLIFPFAFRWLTWHQPLAVSLPRVFAAYGMRQPLVL